MFSLIKIALSIVWLFLTIGVLVNIWKGNSSSTLNKVLWTLGIFLFPFLGPLAFILLSDRAGK